MLSKIICDLAPDQQNNRNSEGAFIELKDGRILFVYSRYADMGCKDDAEADLYGVISKDQGESFGEPFEVLNRAEVDATNVMSVSLMRMANGDIGMFYLKKSEVDQCRYYLKRSKDEGKSFGPPVCCIEERGYYVVNNDRVIRTKSGRLLFAAAYHKTHSELNEEGTKYISKFEPGVVQIYASDDDGDTWKKLADNIEVPICGGCTTGAQEPGLLLMNDGRIWCYIRNNTGRQYETFSEDDGVTWSNPLPSRFTSAVSPMCTKRLSDNRILVVWNPIPTYNGRVQRVNGIHTGGRNPLTIAMSEDDGKNYTDPIAIETDEKCGYCYTAIYETNDGGVLLAYCAGGPEDKGILNRTRVRKLYVGV